MLVGRGAVCHSENIGFAVLKKYVRSKEMLCR